jgi:hypothetical protein
MCETMFLHFVPVDGVGLLSRVLSTKLLAGKVCFYVENEPVDTLSMTLYEEHADVGSPRQGTGTGLGQGC